MPLGARRLLMIGGLCVPGGLVAGSYLIGAQLLAVAGVVMVAVALSYRAGGPWFSRLSWAVTGAGLLWLAATAAFLGVIVIAADSNGAGSRIRPGAVQRWRGILCGHGRHRVGGHDAADGQFPPSGRWCWGGVSGLMARRRRPEAGQVPVFSAFLA